jgi:hypothetical protein
MKQRDLSDYAVSEGWNVTNMRFRQRSLGLNQAPRPRMPRSIERPPGSDLSKAADDQAITAEYPFCNSTNDRRPLQPRSSPNRTGAHISGSGVCCFIGLPETFGTLLRQVSRRNRWSRQLQYALDLASTLVCNSVFGRPGSGGSPVAALSGDCRVEIPSTKYARRSMASVLLYPMLQAPGSVREITALNTSCFEYLIRQFSPAGAGSQMYPRTMVLPVATPYPPRTTTRGVACRGVEYSVLTIQ